MADFAGILLKNLEEISSEYEKKAHFTEISWGKKERNRFCAVFMNVFNETKWQFCQFFFFWEGEMMSISLCSNNNNRNINFL